MTGLIVNIHASASVDETASLGAGSTVWNNCQIRNSVVIGEQCVLSKDVYIDSGVRIGNRVKIQNGVSVYAGVVLEDGVFCGPHCVFTNDFFPRAINTDGKLKSAEDWQVSTTRVCYGASIGANAVIVCGVTLGRWSMVGAGSVVTHSVPDYGLVFGNPARLRGFVCACGRRLRDDGCSQGDSIKIRCYACGLDSVVDRAAWESEL